MQKLTTDDLISLERYHKERPRMRAEVIEHKRHRQAPIGAHVTLYFEDGTSASRVIALLPRSRTNVNVSVDLPEAAGRRFGAIIESLGDAPAQIVVERAMYTSPNGQTWAAGTNALATRLQ